MPAYCCICRRTPADYDSLYRFPQNPERRAVWEEKLSAVKNFIQTGAVTYVLFLDRKIHNNVTEIPSRCDQNYEECHISALNI